MIKPVVTYDPDSLMKKACVRQVVLGKCFPMSQASPAPGLKRGGMVGRGGTAAFVRFTRFFLRGGLEGQGEVAVDVLLQHRGRVVDEERRPARHEACRGEPEGGSLFNHD